MTDPATTFPPLRDWEDIQWAHDMLSGLVRGKDSASLAVLFHSMSGVERVAMRSALDVLCWVLHHDHNEAFAENLAKIYDAVSQVSKFPKPPWEE